jgi:hypothetical protein
VNHPNAAATHLALALLAGAASAQDDAPSAWSIVKCARYSDAWVEALRRQGADGIGTEFLARHDAFLASGCTARAEVCPRTAEEFALANIMIAQAMNAGTASTFPPFTCRERSRPTPSAPARPNARRIPDPRR